MCPLASRRQDGVPGGASVVLRSVNRVADGEYDVLRHHQEDPSLSVGHDIQSTYNVITLQQEV